MAASRDVLVLLGDPRLPDPYKRDGVFGAEDLKNVQILKRTLAELAGGYRFEFHDDHTQLIARLERKPPDLVFNLCDTGFRNDAGLELHVPALCEMLGIPCTGAGPSGIVLTYDKTIVHAVGRERGIPVPEQICLEPGEPLVGRALSFPVLIKPSCADGSLGITKDAVARDLASARAYLDGVRRELPDQMFLVQEFLSGAEYGVGLIGNPGDGFTALPPLEVDYSRLDPSLPHLLGYESKADPDSPYWTDIVYRKAASLTDAQLAGMVAHAEYLFERFQCRDYGRFDFRADSSGTIKLMEINCNPAWAHDAKLAQMTGFSGRTHGWMLGEILAAAERRVGRRRS